MKPHIGPSKDGVPDAIFHTPLPSQSPWLGEVLMTPKWIEQENIEQKAAPDTSEEVMVVAARVEDAEPWIAALPQATHQLMAVSDTLDVWKMRVAAGSDSQRRHIIWVLPTGSDNRALTPNASDLVLGVFRFVKALLTTGWGRRPLSMTVVTRGGQAVGKADRVDPSQAGVHGLIGSLSRECPAWQCRLIDLPFGESIGTQWVATMLARPALPHGGVSVWREGHWYERKLLRCHLPAGHGGAYRVGGVYVMLGGAGGLGRVLSRYLIKRFQAKVIWIGRRPLNAEIAQHMDELARVGGIAPQYICADARDPVALAAARATVLARHGVIHGVLHATIVLEDKTLTWMEEDTFKRVWDAKALTSDCMWRVFQHDELDWFMFFSSMQSFAKAVGQSNYAAGCVYTDALAEQMRRETRTPVKVVNWGYWGEVGVVAGADYARLMALIGLGSIDAASAMSVLERTLDSPLEQILFVKTTEPHLLPNLGAIDGLACQLVEASIAAPPTAHAMHDHRPFPDAVHAASAQSARVASLLPGLLAVQLREAKIIGDGGVSGEELAARTALLPPYLRKWVDESLSILARHGHLLQHDGDWLMAPARWAEAIECEKAWRKLKADVRETAHASEAEMLLVETALKSIPAVLRGSESAASVLFPRGSMALVENIYRNNPVADHFNGLLADRLLCTAQAQLRACPTARLRVLEIGAGTGGTSSALFDRLAPVASSMDEYAYTDLSQLFLMHAKERFGHVPYLKRRIFNVEKPVQPQGLALGSYDVVVAANVLHATRHIATTLRNAKALLKRGGVLLVNELASHKVFMHVTFGLLEGWWLYEDPAVRIPGCPVLSPASWESVLLNEGFTHVRHAAADAQAWGQQVIEARSDGLIYQQGPVARV